MRTSRFTSSCAALVLACSVLGCQEPSPDADAGHSHHETDAAPHSHDIDSGPGPQGHTPPPTIDGAAQVTVTATDWAFDPSILRVNVGDALNIELVNEGTEAHMYEIEGHDFHLHAQPGEAAIGGVVFETAGIFEVVCTIDYEGETHADLGMRGLIHVMP